MRKYFLIFAVFLYVSSALAAGHITKAQKEKTIECLGHYSATAVLPAETIEVKNMELALASVKVIREYLASEGVKDDEMNKGMNAYVDKVYGKPFDKAILFKLFDLCKDGLLFSSTIPSGSLSITIYLILSLNLG